MIAALARASQALDEPAYQAAAKRSADFVLTARHNEKGRLCRRYRLGERAFPGFLEDYASMVWGLIELYESTFEVRYLKEALDLNDVMHTLFWDDAGGGFFFVGKDSEQMIGPTQEIVVVGDPGYKKTTDMLHAVKQAYLPNKVLLFRGKQEAFDELDDIASCAGKMASAVSADRSTTFWCQQYACREPITKIETLESIISST